MTRLDEILDTAKLKQLIADGYIRERFHPDDPTLRILNYAEKAQYEKHWVHETLTCRGLIVQGPYIVARSWPKFFNYGEHEEGALDLDARAEVTDKADGSLGILYDGPNGWEIATRGSFSSEQAIHATQVFRDRYSSWTPNPGWTFLYEIVYPENRIVLDYDGTDDLIYLGAVHTQTGEIAGPGFFPEWPGPRTTLFPVSTLAAALALPPRENAEGLVVRYIDGGVMVKLKYPDYVKLHKLVTGLSERSVWEHLSATDGYFDDLLAEIPDEFHGWVVEKANALSDAHDSIMGRAHASFYRVQGELGDDYERGDYARRIADDIDRALLFMLLDGKDISPAIWKQLKPVGSNPMKYLSEATA